MALVLFDIDGTLLRTAGAGREALDEAIARVHGWPQATRGIDVAGSTDRVILEGVAAAFGAAVDHPAVERHYLDGLGRRLADPARTVVLPGVVRLLDALAGRATVGLLTGNWVSGAAIKLRAARLDGAFGFGAYADDGPDRNALLPVARERARRAGWSGRGPVLVIGDTRADIRCARSGDAVAVAVRTGFCSLAELQDEAPDLLLDDLEQGHEAVLAALG